MTQKVEFPAKLECLFRPSRYKVLYGGRGGTKSWGAARALLLKGASSRIRVLCAREFQASMRDSVHSLLVDQIEALGLSSVYTVTRDAITGSNGTHFGFVGLRMNAASLKSWEGADVCWVEEANTVSDRSWDILIPTIRKPGSEIWITFNPEFEDDPAYRRFVVDPPADSIVVHLTYRDNPWFPDVLEAERLELKRKDPDSYDHVWEGRCRQWLSGAIYGPQLRAAYDEGRITDVPHDPETTVYTAWDLGRTDDTAIWWYQIVGQEIHVLESWSQSGASPSDLASQILGKQVTIDIVDGEMQVKVGGPQEGAEHRQAYQYESHWLPHDARAKTLAAFGKSVQQQLQAALEAPVRIVPSLSLEDGIQAARTTFPRCWFDQTGCATGLKALRKYQRELQSDDISLRAKPKHDWSSHASDAFRYLSIAWRSHSELQDIPRPSRDPWEVAISEDTDSWRV